jgi:hypothetical protein
LSYFDVVLGTVGIGHKKPLSPSLVFGSSQQTISRFEIGLLYPTVQRQNAENFKQMFPEKE